MSYSAAELGWDEFFEEQRVALGVDMSDVGRVVSSIGIHVFVEIPDVGPAEVLLTRSNSFPAHMIRPVEGDWAILDRDEGVLGGLFERKTLVKRQRPGKSTATQPVVANVDIVAIVTSANRDFNPRRLERYLTVVWDSGAKPLIVVNKSDLVEDVRAFIDDAIDVAPGVEVIGLSAIYDPDFEALRAYLHRGTTIAFLGSSGVGKSTIINRLLGETRLETGEIRDEDDKGRHTTTRRELIVMPERVGMVIDTPGMREIQLTANEEGLEIAFEEIVRLAEDCRFRDCTHENEPGCAVLAAVESGELDFNRLRNYRDMAAEIAYHHRQKDPELSKQERKRGKDIAKSAKRFRKIDPKG